MTGKGGRWRGNSMQALKDLYKTKTKDELTYLDSLNKPGKEPQGVKKKDGIRKEDRPQPD